MDDTDTAREIVPINSDEDDVLKKTYSMEILVVGMAVAMMLIYFANRFYEIVPAGHKGVYFSTFGGGTQLDTYYDEGLKLKFPWDYVFIYNTRIQEYQDTVLALTEDGLEVYAEVSFRYFPDYNQLGRLHKEIGPDYLYTILVPRITALTRDVISRYDVDKLYNTSRDTIQNIMTQQSVYEITDNYPIEIADIVIRSIKLPFKLMEAIKDKLVLEQELLGYDYRLDTETKEALRKEIEAMGIRAFLDTSNLDILKWEGIKATKELATSENAKIIVIGTDNGDLPIILGGNN